MLKRNWLAIAQVQGYYLRLAVSLTNDPEILACFARGFPHLFTDGEDEGPLHIPLSALKEGAFQFSKAQSPDPMPDNLWEIDSHFWLSAAADIYPHLSVPIEHDWGDEGPTTSSISAEILSQFVGQKVGAGIRIKYLGRQYVVLDVTFHHGEEGPKLGSTFEAPPELDYLTLALADFVAIDK